MEHDRRTAIITGGGKGIGRATAEVMLREGANVVILDKDEMQGKTLEEATKERVLLVRCDVSVEKEDKSAIAKAKQAFGQINYLVNNAGIAIGADVESDDEAFADSWSKTMSVNLLAAGLLCKKAINHFQKTDGGRIVNISSRAAFRGDTSDNKANADSKGGVVALTRYIARAYAKQNIKA